jgi:hypothetical protein
MQIIDVTKTELENRLKMVENERDLQKERLKIVEKQNKVILPYLERLELRVPEVVNQIRR